jgi:hypothetical protein
MRMVGLRMPLAKGAEGDVVNWSLAWSPSSELTSFQSVWGFPEGGDFLRRRSFIWEWMWGRMTRMAPRR